VYMGSSKKMILPRRWDCMLTVDEED
jgi:hypothetical protein